MKALIQELDEANTRRERAEAEAEGWTLAGDTFKAEAAHKLAQSYSQQIADVLARLADELPG